MALLRQRTGINASRAVTGPLCSGDWHYTVVEVPDREPVQVITMGSLTLMEAGTEVCTPEIRVRAPAGIKAAVC